MKTQEVQFNGITYTCRVVESNEGEELLIGSTVLLDALHPGSFEDENEGFASKEAEQLYDEIFFLHGQKHPQFARRGTDCRTEARQSRMVRLNKSIII